MLLDYESGVNDFAHESRTYDPPDEAEAWSDTGRIARLFVRERYTDPGHPHRLITRWRGEWHAWTAAAGWQVTPRDAIRAEVTKFAGEVFRTDYAVRSADAPSGKPPDKFHVTKTVVENVLLHLESICLVDEKSEQPRWLRDITGRPLAAAVVAAPNGLFTLDDIAAGRPAFAAPTPDLFSPSVLGFAVPDDPGPATIWLQSLDQWFGGDRDSVRKLQEWFGYLLTADTSAQKALLLVGPPRSGKGTILQTLELLVGAGHVASTTFEKLGQRFGLQPLLGRKVAVIPDARLSGKTDSQAVVERILSVTGDDIQSVDRKNLTEVSTRLGCRFVVATNELPRLKDASGAIMTRFDVLQTVRSFTDNPDTRLAEKIRRELPGILKWAAGGWVRLSRSGMRFTAAAAAAGQVRLMAEMASPLKAFIDECCEIDPAAYVPRESLWAAWVRWSDARSSTPGTTTDFGRDLKAAFPGINKKQRRVAGTGKQVWCDVGVRLRSEHPSKQFGDSGRMVTVTG